MTPPTRYLDMKPGDVRYELVTEVRVVHAVEQRDEPPGRGTVGHTVTTLLKETKELNGGYAVENAIRGLLG